MSTSAQQQPSVEAESADTGEDATGMAEEVTPEEEETTSFFKRWMAVAAVVLIALIGLAWWLIPSSEPPEQLAGQTADQQLTQVSPQGTETQDTASALVAKEPVPEPGAPIRTIHTVVEGQSLWRISRRHYANPLLWPEIFKANDDQIDDPDLIFPNQEFKIPEPQ